MVALALVSQPLAAGERLRVAAVFATTTEEPWVNQIHRALRQAQARLGIEYRWSEGVSAEQFPALLRSYARGGAHLLMGDAFSNEFAARAVAREFPETAFVFGSGLGPAAPNFSVFDNWVHEPAYLAGLIAGDLTRTRQVGVVGAMPIPEVNRISNAFCAGARRADRHIRCRVSFIDTFFDPRRARLAALAQIDAGVDVIFAERDGAIEAAAERRVLAIGNLEDQFTSDPETVVTSVVWDMWPTVERVITLVRNRDYGAQDFREYSFMYKGGSRLAPYHAFESRLPACTKALVAAQARAIVEGTLRVDINESAPDSR